MKSFEVKDFKFTVTFRAGDGNGGSLEMHWQNPPIGHSGGIPEKLKNAVHAVIGNLGTIPLGGWGVDFWAWNVPKEWLTEDKVFESVDDLEVLED